VFLPDEKYTDSHINTYTLKHKLAFTHMCAHTNTLTMQAHTCPHILTQTHRHIPTHSKAHTCRYICTHIIHSFTHKHVYTNINSNTHTLTKTHTYTHSQMNTDIHT
jgi:hypothetical protein